MPTSEILIPPSKSGKRVADSLADSLATRFADSGGGLYPKRNGRSGMECGDGLPWSHPLLLYSRPRFVLHGPSPAPRDMRR